MRSRRALVIPLAVAALAAGLAVPGHAGPAAAGGPRVAHRPRRAPPPRRRCPPAACRRPRPEPPARCRSSAAFLVVHRGRRDLEMNAAGQTAWTDSGRNLCPTTGS